MTSSNGNDWFPPVEKDCSKKQRITVEFTDSIVSQLAVVADREDRSIAGQIRHICKSFLSQQNTSLACDGVSVREGEESPGMENNVRSTTSSQEHITNKKGRDGVGEESEKPPRKGSWKKEFPDCLAEFEQQITDFWKEKKGSKSERAWTLLMKELSAIHAHLNVGRSPANRERFLEQLELATANRWQGITLKNFKQFSEGTPGKAPEPEIKHPASNVFKASDLNWPKPGESW